MTPEFVQAIGQYVVIPICSVVGFAVFIWWVKD